MALYVRFIGLVVVLYCTACARVLVPEPVGIDSNKVSMSRVQLPSSSSYASVFVSPTTNKHLGAVASVNPIATKAGLDALAKGGNAIDAALATAFTLGVVDSHNSGIGGGCFILARLADGRILAIDGREMAAARASEDMYLLNGKVQSSWSKTGALAPGIPGSVAALEVLQKEGGRLNFKDVLLPAALVAETGFAVDKTMALRLKRTASALAQFPQSAAIFLDAEQKPLAEGAWLRQPELAQSYRSLALEGSDWFYRGAFAQKTSAWMAENDGIITAADFANYKVLLREPVTSQYKNFTILGFPPPSSGGAHVAQLLNLFELLDVPAYSDDDAYHLIAESMKLAFADRAYWMGDADFVPVPRGLITPEYAQTLAKKITLNKAAVDVSFDTPPLSAEDLFGKHTTHIATADAQGNWVAITTTLNTSFGSKVVVPGTGVLLNNQMDDFVAEPGAPNAFGLVGSKANSIAPGKRPLSSMSPTLVFKDGQPFLTLGAAGGPTIISQVAQNLLWVLGYKNELAAALARPRVHHQWRPNLLFVEEAIPLDVQESLSKKGHQLKSLGSFGGTQAISWDGEFFTAVTEPRVVERNSAPSD